MDTIHEVIQFSMAPVFLLTGIGGILGVLAGRLTRIVERAREIEERLAATPGGIKADAGAHDQLVTLVRRARLTNAAISLCVLSALLISVAITALFAGAYIEQLPVLPIALTFISALAALIVALLCFLREVYLATASLRITVK
jgi:hypothetical protein